MTPGDGPWAPAAPKAPRQGPGDDPWAADGRSPADPEITEHGLEKAAGICYLLHFSQPYKHARHYQGFAESSRSLTSRLADHEQGRGARLLQIVKAAGITWTLARTWPGDRARERQLKNQGGASRRCPECGITPRHGQGEPKDIAAMKPQPGRDPERTRAAAPADRAGASWAREQLAAQIQRTSAASAHAGPSGGRTAPEPDGPPVAELEAEP